VEVLQDDLPATLYATGQLHHVLSLKTTKTIKAGDQLWLDYGKPFWTSIDVCDNGMHCIQNCTNSTLSSQVCWCQSRWFSRDPTL
jgi:hypothetical protein